MAEAKKKGVAKRAQTKEKTSAGKRKKKLPADVSMEELMHIRAYEIFEERSKRGEAGPDAQLADWCQAEREVLEQYGS